MGSTHTSPHAIKLREEQLFVCALSFFTFSTVKGDTKFEKTIPLAQDCISSSLLSFASLFGTGLQGSDLVPSNFNMTAFLRSKSAWLSCNTVICLHIKFERIVL